MQWLSRAPSDISSASAAVLKICTGKRRAKWGALWSTGQLVLWPDWGKGVRGRPTCIHEIQRLYSSLNYSQRRNCVFLCPFIIKAAVTTGLVKCGVAPPSQATPPSRMSVQSYTPIVCTVVERSTLPVKERTLWFCWTWEYHRSSLSLGSCCLEASLKCFTKVITPRWMNEGESKKSVALSEISTVQRVHLACLGCLDGGLGEKRTWRLLKPCSSIQIF